MYYQSNTHPDVRARIESHANGVVKYTRYSASATFDPAQASMFEDTFFAEYAPKSWLS